MRWLFDNHSDQLMLMTQDIVEVVYLTWYLYTLVIKDRSSGRQVEWTGKLVHDNFEEDSLLNFPLYLY